MLIVMESKINREIIDSVCREVERMGLKAHPIPGSIRTAIGVTGNKSQVDSDRILAQPGVKEIIHVTKPFKLVSREFYPENSVVDVNGVKVGGRELVVMAGPCAVENRDQCMT
ncbi:MAG: 3-deoxy-7-phosphoheptulonate synthase, partial [candidate division Zixibacteria bacterium]|nr:3-deoxy-7-phosphoheptulonate synthase [candidate division Zixibacteria bacterium]